jgi:hypothetical protein
MDIWRRALGKPALLAVFFMCAVPTGLMMSLITPPGQSPDEPAHLARAAGLLHGAILAVRKPDIDPLTGKPELHTGVKADAGLFSAAFGHVTIIGGRPVVTSQGFLADRAVPADHDRIFINLPNTATYFPIAYVPAALGLALGLTAHAPPFACFLLARLCMLAAYVAVGGLAIWLAAYGEALLFTVLLLPMTLFLGSTLNQDGLLTAMTCLACAALTRGYSVLGLVMFALVLGSKPPYALLLGVFLLPLFGPGFWRRVRDVALASVPVVLWVALIAAFVVVPYGKQAYHPGPLYTGAQILFDHADAHENLKILWAEPSRFFSLPWQAVTSYWWLDLWTMVGVLGPLQLVLPKAYCHAWEWCLLAGLLGAFFTRREAVPLAASAANFLVVLALLAVTCWLILIMFYLDWTNVGDNYVDGIQGRYLLILLPFLLFAMPAVRWRWALPPLVPALPAVAMGLVDIGYLPMKLVWNYYLH